MFGISIKQWLTIFGVAVVLGLVGLWQVYEHRFQIFELRFAPQHDFDAAQTPTAPDYADPANWLGMTDMVPKAMMPLPDAQRQADVFYVHATTYDKPDAWNAPVDDAKLNLVTDKFYGARQASMFNGCCRIYAPRYRQGTLFASRRANDNSYATMNVAYSDIRAAFQHYMQHENNGRPFILASHSQGTSHLERLLFDEIAGKPWQSRMVAAYLVGYWLPAELPQRVGIPACASPTQTGCLIAWDSYTKDRKPFDKMDAVGHWDGTRYSTEGSGKKLCVNPISWRADLEQAGPAKGSLPVDYSAALFLDQDKDPHLPPLVDAEVTAQCGEDGKLYVPLFIDGVFRYKITMPSYHRFDMEFFYQDIWENAQARVTAFVNEQP